MTCWIKQIDRETQPSWFFVKKHKELTKFRKDILSTGVVKGDYLKMLDEQISQYYAMAVLRGRKYL